MSALPNITDEGRMKDVVLVIMLGVGQALAMGAAAFATRNIFAALQAAHPAPLTDLVLFAIAGVLIAVLQVAARIRAEALGQSYARSLRQVLYRHIAGMSHQDLASRRIGAMSLRFVGDLAAARGWVGLGLTRCIAAAVILPGAITSLWLLSPVLAVAGMGPVVLALVLALALAVGLGPRHKAVRSRRASIAISSMERIALAPSLDLARRTRKELDRLDRDSRSLAKGAVARITRSAWLRTAPQLGAALGGMGVLWVASRAGAPASQAAGALAVLAIVALPLRDLAGAWDRFCAWRVAKGKCLTLFALQSTPRRIKRARAPVPVQMRDVTFRGLSVDLDVPAGAEVYVTGPPGSGKSALLSLIASQNPPQTGEVKYGCEPGTLPRIAYLSTTPLVLQGSLRRALTLGCTRRPSDDRIAETADALGLATLTERLGGLDGRVSEGGRNVSSSECLRIELVRAILTRPDLIVIDTPWFATDPGRARLRDQLRERTGATLIIAAEGMVGGDDAFTLTVAGGSAQLSRAARGVATAA